LVGGYQGEGAGRNQAFISRLNLRGRSVEHVGVLFDHIVIQRALGQTAVTKKLGKNTTRQLSVA